MKSTRQLITAAAACVDCGKEHQPRPYGAKGQTWAAKDGHAYAPRIGRMLNNNGSAVVAALRTLAQESP